jgi:hypothetical protein
MQEWNCGPRFGPVRWMRAVPGSAYLGSAQQCAKYKYTLSLYIKIQNTRYKINLKNKTMC